MRTENAAMEPEPSNRIKYLERELNLMHSAGTDCTLYFDMLYDEFRKLGGAQCEVCDRFVSEIHDELKKRPVCSEDCYAEAIDRIDGWCQ